MSIGGRLSKDKTPIRTINGVGCRKASGKPSKAKPVRVASNPQPQLTHRQRQIGRQRAIKAERQKDQKWYRKPQRRKGSQKNLGHKQHLLPGYQPGLRRSRQRPLNTRRASMKTKLRWNPGAAGNGEVIGPTGERESHEQSLHGQAVSATLQNDGMTIARSKVR